MHSNHMIITYFRLSEKERQKKLMPSGTAELLDSGRIAPGYAHVAVLQNDGTVTAYGNNECSQCDTSAWSGIIKVAAGDHHTVALTKDGTVVAVGDNTYGQCNVSEWSGICDVFAEKGMTIGVKSDGSVIFSVPEEEEKKAEDSKAEDADFSTDDDIDMTPAPVSAFSYTKLFGGIQIEKYYLDSRIVVIPPVIEGKPVNVINRSAFEGKSCHRVVLPDSLEAIFDRAFHNCRNLERIHIPDSVTIIGDNAFTGCISLTRIALPKCLRQLGKGAFSSCPALKAVRIPLTARNRINSGSIREAFDDLSIIQ